ncbi:stress response protein NST1-like [Hippoglossus stenolepis]|uniref:stress response protein NST1-like n=1 Tax=Hippoglossus stenolepis TaxID=195615 RepID=UPI001FAFE8EF|nr:stress response protein NST1-like [Hippoglossus stenolepis]
MQTQIHQLKSGWDLKVNTLEDQLRREQVEQETCLQQIKELKSVVKATEKKWLNLQEDVHRNVELMEKLTAMPTQIHQSDTDWDVRVNNLVKATEKTLLKLQEDSQIKSEKMDEDIKFLIVKSIKLQELALMSDSDKARRRRDERKAQKEEEKRLKKELKEKKEQEKREIKQREKEAKKEKRKTTSHLPSPC